MSAFEQWLIQKLQSCTDSLSAEAWHLTAKCAAATSFDILLSSYKLYCQNFNNAGAAEILQQMYMQFNDEQRFWREVEHLVDAIKVGGGGTQHQFYRTCFQTLVPVLQQSLLLEVAERTQDRARQCELYLLLLRMFPDSVPMFGLQLVDGLLLLSAQDDQSVTPLLSPGAYKQLLFGEVLPVILNTLELPLSEEKILEYLDAAIQFYIAYFSAHNFSDGNGDFTEKEQNTALDNDTKNAKETALETADEIVTSPWEHLLQLVTGAAKRLHWKVLSLLTDFSFERMETVFNCIDSQSTKKSPATSVEENYLALLICVRLAFMQTKPRIDGSVTILAYVPSDILKAAPVSQEPVLPKKKKLEKPPNPEFCKTLLSYRSAASDKNDGDWQKIYLLGVRTAALLQGNSLLQTFLTTLNKPEVIVHFLIDCALCDGKTARVLDLLDKPDKPRDYFQRAGCFFAESQHSIAVTEACHALKLLARRERSVQFEFVRLADEQHLAQLAESHMLCYVVRIALASLRPLPVLPKASDLFLGHAIILMQNDWLHYYRAFHTIIDAIKQRGAFNYPKFSKWIGQLDIIEEFTALYDERKISQVVFACTLQKDAGLALVMEHVNVLLLKFLTQQEDTFIQCITT